jgi:uncharacterized protein (TIGR02145 family)
MKKIILLTTLVTILSYFTAIRSNSTGDSKTKTNESIISAGFPENTFIDKRDNQQYKYVIIAGKKWMAENLHFKTPNSLTYNNKEKNAEIFGRLYNWKEANCGCPDQWRLPTEDDWKALEASIGLNSKAIDSVGWRGGSFGNQLKSNSKIWLTDIKINIPNVGFEAIPAGLAYSNNYFAYKGLGGYFWTATNYYSSFAWSRYLRHDKGEIFRNISAINWYLSVRCVKD